VELADGKIEDALADKPGYDRKLYYSRDRLVEMRKQAAPYAKESNAYLSYRCVPVSLEKGEDAETACGISSARFQRDYGLALKGDYTAQKNVISCLEGNSCDGVVKINEPLTCVWRIVSLASGDKRSNDDWFNKEAYQHDCVKKRTPTEIAVIRAQAEALLERIYHKPLPRDFNPKPSNPPYRSSPTLSQT
jgi:hypothetical protein